MPEDATRDYRTLFTQTELARLIERFICLYTREPAEQWNHSTEEMMAVLQEAKQATALRQRVEELAEQVRLLVNAKAAVSEDYSHTSVALSAARQRVEELRAGWLTAQAVFHSEQKHEGGTFLDCEWPTCVAARAALKEAK